MKIIACDADIQEGLNALARIDPRFVPVIAASGPIPLRRHAPGFSGLANIIVSQQLSVASANAIWARTLRNLGEVSPAAILSADDPALRACGLSAPKMRTLRALAEAAHSGALPVDALHTMSADAAIAHLTAVKGIGDWSAHMFLMFQLLMVFLLQILIF